MAKMSSLLNDDIKPLLVNIKQRKDLQTAVDNDLKVSTVPGSSKYYTASQAKSLYGIDTPNADYMLKVTPSEKGYSYSFVTPSKYQINDNDTVTYPNGNSVSYADIDDTDDYNQIKSVFGDIYSNQDITTLRQYATTNPQQFMTKIRQSGRNEKTLNLVNKLFPGADEAKINQLFGEEEQEEQNIFSQAWDKVTKTAGKVGNWLTTPQGINQNEYVQQLQQKADSLPDSVKNNPNYREFMYQLTQHTPLESMFKNVNPYTQYGEEAGKNFATAVTQPFREGNIQSTGIESYTSGGKEREQYEQWESPKYVKGAIETVGSLIEPSAIVPITGSVKLGGKALEKGAESLAKKAGFETVGDLLQSERGAIGDLSRGIPDKELDSLMDDLGLWYAKSKKGNRELLTIKKAKDWLNTKEASLRESAEKIWGKKKVESLEKTIGKVEPVNPTANEVKNTIPKEGTEIPNAGKNADIPPNEPIKTTSGQPSQPENAISELVAALKKGKTLQAPTKAMQHETRSQRAAVASGYMKNQNLTTDEAMRRAKSAYAGKMDRPELAPLDISDEAKQTLRDTVRTTPAIPDNFVFTRTTADDALQKVFSGELPTKGEIGLLEELFGTELGGALKGLRPLKDKITENVLDALNLPRSLKASWDYSAPLRQGVWLFVGNVKRAIPAARDMIKASLSEKFGQNLDDFYRGNIKKGIAPDANWVKSQEHRLYYAPYRQGQGTLTQREEQFMSKLADKIPGVRASERAYITYLNKFRQDVWAHYSKRLDKLGAENWEYDELAKFINIATGRGELGKLSGMAPYLSTMLFSPRMQAATIELPAMLISKSPAVRKIAAENIGETLAAGAGVLGLASLAGADVELDPRSTDFAKIRVGNTRIDIWGGKQQYTVALARLITGQKKTENGDIVEIGPDSFSGDRLDYLNHFIRGKLAPGPALLTDLASGADYLGNRMTPDRSGEIAINTLTPMSLYQTYESAREDQAAGAAMSGLGYFGVGVSSYGGEQSKLLREYQPDFKEFEAIPSNDMEAKSIGSVTRDTYLTLNPKINAELFVTGQVNSLNTITAANQAYNLIQQNQIDVNEIKGLSSLKKKQDEREKYGQEDTSIDPIDILDAKLNNAVTPEIQYKENQLLLKDEWRSHDEAYRLIGDPNSKYYIEDDTEREKKREAILKKYPKYAEARYRMQAYSYQIPEKYHDLYVEYSKLPDSGEGSTTKKRQWLLSHRDYYKTVWLGILGNKPIESSSTSGSSLSSSGRMSGSTLR